MRVLLVRHSDAVQGGGELDDAARYLTHAGRIKARHVAELVRDQGVKITRFVVSPRVRAVQTAEIFADVLGFGDVIEVLPSLSYTQPAQRAANDLAGMRGTIAAFGHMPTIAEVATLLCHGRGPGGFSPSEAVWLEEGKPRWSVDPDALRVRTH